MGKRFSVTEGQQFSNYIVLSDKFHIGRDGKRYYNCRCTCGTVNLVRVSNLFRDGFVGCKSCISKHNYNLHTKVKWDAVRSNAVGDLSGTFFSHIRQSAKSRNIHFDLSMDFAWGLLVEQDFKCALSGVDIKLSLERKGSDPNFSEIAASLDRIDSSKGYTIDNVQWVHKDVNRMKWSLSNSDFISYCCKVASKHGNTEPSPGNFNSTGKVQRIEGEPDAGDNPSTKNGHPTPWAG